VRAGHADGRPHVGDAGRQGLNRLFSSVHRPGVRTLHATEDGRGGDPCLGGGGPRASPATYVWLLRIRAEAATTPAQATWRHLATHLFPSVYPRRRPAFFRDCRGGTSARIDDEMGLRCRCVSPARRWRAARSRWRNGTGFSARMFSQDVFADSWIENGFGELLRGPGGVRGYVGQDEWPFFGNRRLRHAHS